MWKYKGQSYSWGPPADRLIKNGIVVCPRCEKNEAHLDKQYGVSNCEDCQAQSQGFTDHTRSQYTPQYIKDQQAKHHNDFVQPHITENGKNKINPEFVNLYPEKAHLYYTPEEIKQAGYPKLVEYSEKVQRVESQQKQKIEEYKRKVIEYRQTGDPTQLRDFMSKLRK